MKKITLLITAAFLTINLCAQKKKHPKYEHHFKAPTVVSTNEYELNFFDIQSQAEFCKMAVKIKNKTNDFLAFDTGSSIFKFDFGEFSEKQKRILIKPNNDKRKTLGVNGSSNFQVETFSLKFDGISIIPVKGKISPLENFQVPPSKNSIENEIFKVNLKKSSLRTQEAALIFECIYQGDKVGIINPSKLTIKVDGTDKEYANDIKNPDAKLIFKKGDKVKVKAIFHIPGRIADMQFANMTIIWNDTFVESEAKKLSPQEIIFEIDRGMTNGKN